MLFCEDGDPKVEGDGDTEDKVKGGEFAGKFLHGEDQLVDFPLELAVDDELVECFNSLGAIGFWRTFFFPIDDRLF